MSAIALPSSDISIHALRGEGDLVEQLGISGAVTDISIHALRGEGDPAPSLTSTAASTFQSTPSVGRATLPENSKHLPLKNFNPRPPWGGRRYEVSTLDTSGVISIHALRGEGDSVGLPALGHYRDISIHALRGEGDDKAELINKINKHFNPRPPWGGRPGLRLVAAAKPYFNPRPPWGGRRASWFQIRHQRHFNPRPPWGGRQKLRPIFWQHLCHFNPRPPWGGRHRLQYQYLTTAFISIHALRGEGD